MKVERLERTAGVILLIFHIAASRELYTQRDLEDGSGDLPLDRLLDDLEPGSRYDADQDEEGSGNWEVFPSGGNGDRTPDYDVRMESISHKTVLDEGAEMEEEWYDYYDEPHTADDYANSLGGYTSEASSELPQGSTHKPEAADQQPEKNIEIKPRPTEEEEIIIETSQILIMVGSAFVSFVIFMLTFFMCRRALAKQKAKAVSAHLPEKRVETSIVKDYQKVPSSTLEILQQESTIRNQQMDNPSMEPLVK